MKRNKAISFRRKLNAIFSIGC